MEDKITASTMEDKTTASTMEYKTTASTMEDETPTKKIKLEVRDYNLKPGFKEHCFTLTSTQEKFAHFLRDWLENPRRMLLIVTGGPGTGKTYAVSETLKFCELEPLIMSYTGRAAYHIGGRTIHSMVQIKYSADSECKRLEKKVNHLGVTVAIEESKSILDEFDYTGNKHYIIILDEISMVCGWMTYWLIKYFMVKFEGPLLFIMVGDPLQLRPIGCNHNAFSLITHLEVQYKVPRIKFVENKRFTPKYQVLIDKLKAYPKGKKSDVLKFLSENFPVKDIADSVLEQATKAMAFTNATVDSYNHFYIRKKLPGEVIQIKRQYVDNKGSKKTNYLEIKPNCAIFVTENQKNEEKKVKNGTPLTFINYNTETDSLECRGRDGSEVEVRRNIETEGFPINIGFAETIHKFQGEVIGDEKIVINFDGSKDSHLIYRALSRVRDVRQILAVQL